MEFIDWRYIVQTSISDKLIVPTSVDYNCPLCGRNVNFSLSWNGTPNATYTATARCSGCKASPIFVYVWASFRENTSQIRGELYIYPKTKKRNEINGLNELNLINQDVKDEYISALNVYNIREWRAATGTCRRVLEGLMQSITPESEHHKNLFQLISSIDMYVDLKKPITDVADVLRIAGNKGAHFDPVSKPTEKSTEIMFDLMDYLVEYFFILPDKIKSLHDEVEKLSKKDN
jgi:hypothetical protein